MEEPVRDPRAGVVTEHGNTPPPPHSTPPQGWRPSEGRAPQHSPPPAWMPPPAQPGNYGAPPHWGGPQQWGPPPKPPTLPTEPREYPAFWRAPGIKAWRPILAIILGAIGFFVISMVVTISAILLSAVITGGSVAEEFLKLTDGIITPTVFLANSVSLGLLIPLTFLLSRLVGQKGGWLSSVVGRVRWGWLMKCFLVSFLAVGAFFVIGTSIEGWSELELSLRPGWWLLLIGVLVVTPFQAAGEEYLVRGVLNRGVASLIPMRTLGAILGAVVSSGVFMLLHGAGDIWLNITYFTMGMLFSYLAWRTGGLEAAVAMHAANNLVALVFLPFQDISDIFNREEGTGDPAVLLQLLLLGVAAFIIVIMARRGNIVRATAPASGAPMVPVSPPVFAEPLGLS
ncbi:MAG: CPBP family intramembrane metalloprotease [Propionibacteriaceae bacterium]|nr:CPBP family intramembrane metalloprotease [Propionibacteriaceae bacterium]